MTDQTAGTETQAPETTVAPETTETQQAPDLNAQLSEHFDRLSQGFTQQLQDLEQRLDAQQTYEEPYDPYQQSDPYGGLDPNDPVQAQLIQTQQALQAMQQSQERFAQENWSRDVQALGERIPDLNKEEIAKPVVDHAKFLVQSLGGDPNGIIPVALIETAYGKYMADQIASKQQPIEQVQQGQAHLEGAGASAVAPEQDQVAEMFKPQDRPDTIFGF
jgi:exonuclease VII large subunit